MDSDSNTCINCAQELDPETSEEGLASKCQKINIALPTITDPINPISPPQISTPGQVPSIQILELSIKEILLEIYGQTFSNLPGQDGHSPLSVCPSCSSNLANLYLAHRNFIQTRHVNSFLAQQDSRKVTLTKTNPSSEENFPNFPLLPETEILPATVSNEVNHGNGIDMVSADCEEPSGDIILSIVPQVSNSWSKEVPQSEKTILNPAIPDQIILIDIPQVQLCLGSSSSSSIEKLKEKKKPEDREFTQLPRARPGVKVNVIKTPKLKRPSEKFLPCASCNLEFQSPDDLNQHQLLIHEYTGSGRGLSKNLPKKDTVLFTVKLDQGQCQFPSCNFSAVSKEEAVDHYVALHSRCEDDIEQARGLGFGLIQFDVEEDSLGPDLISRYTPTGPPPYSCKFCDFSSTEAPESLKDFMDHLRSKHLNSIQNYETERASKSGSLPGTFSIVFPDRTVQFSLPDNRCPYCGKQVFCKGSWNPMKVHIREMHLWTLTRKSFKCPKCPKIFQRRYAAKAHALRCGRPDLRKNRKKRTEKIHCEKCGRSFTNAGFLRNHLESKCGRVFSCEVCGSEFKKNAQLASHMVSHATERPFFCEYCGRNYKSKHALSFHQKISHTEEGRLKYNEMMRSKNRRRKLALQHAGGKK